MIRADDSLGGVAAPVTPRPQTRPERPALRALLLGTLLAVAVAVPGQAAQTITKTKPATKQRLTLESPLTAPFQAPSETGSFSFTAPGAAGAASRLQSVERAFRFTPSGQSDNRKALSLGMSTRLTAATSDRSRAAPPPEALASLPTSYNVDLSLAWKGFAVNTGYTHVEPGPLALLSQRRDAVDLGVSYRGKNWKTTLQGTAEEVSPLLFAPLERRYSVEIGGSYAVAPRLSVTGGVRYKLAPEAPSLLSPDRADQSVYLGTNFAF